MNRIIRTKPVRFPVRAEDEYSYPLHTVGTASGGYGEEEEDVGAKLRQVVKEVTGKDIEAPVKPRIGFLP